MATTTGQDAAQPQEKFLRTTLPAALGAGVRVPYTLAVARFGGRNWTVISAGLLLVPTVATGPRRGRTAA
jgi:MFS transporter, NNP family, nitrate/nitrite transporter